MAVGSLRAVVVDVNDLEAGERFWGAVTGLPVTLRAWQGQYTRLGVAGQGSVLLQLVGEEKAIGKNRVHMDITVDDLEGGIDEVEALGGSLVSGPHVYPETEPADRRYAVMQDPFGNEFCLVHDLAEARA